MNRGVKGRVGRQLRVLRVLRRIFEAKVVLQEIWFLPLGRDLNRKPGQVFRLRFGQIEGEERLGVSAIGLYREFIRIFWSHRINAAGRPLPFLVSWVHRWVIAPLAQLPEKVLSCHARTILVSSALMAF